MKIAVAQINYHIGNFAENLNRIIAEIVAAKKENCDLILFSELAICGYPPLDLLEHQSFISKCEQSIKELLPHTRDIAVLIGAPTINPNKLGKKLYNSVCFLTEGEVRDVFHKSLLPTYDIFDEYRYFEPNTDFHLLELKNKKIAVTICEDLWFNQPAENTFANQNLYTVDPVIELMRMEPDLLVNLAASPYAYNRSDVKKEIFSRCAGENDIPLVYVNQVGAQTELIFEGGSLVINRKGDVVHELGSFQADRLYFDLDDCRQDGIAVEKKSEEQHISEIHQALVMGVADYFRKSGLSKATLGLSGGIDSAVTLAIAAEALGKENVHALLLPSQYSSDHSITDAEEECHNLNCSFSRISIREIFSEYSSALQPLFADREEDITEENIQSRIRGTLLMAYSNKFGHILLNTSNKSEASVGYGTLYGDLAGGISVLGDVYKTYVYRLAKYINRDKPVIPENVINKPPSAELKPDQKDTDSLPEYDLLDKILFAYIEQQKDPETIIGSGFDPGTVRHIISLVNMNEYKRYQSPPILRISTKAFGAGRRMPLAAKY